MNQKHPVIGQQVQTEYWQSKHHSLRMVAHHAVWRRTSCERHGSPRSCFGYTSSTDAKEDVSVSLATIRVSPDSHIIGKFHESNMLNPILKCTQQDLSPEATSSQNENQRLVPAYPAHHESMEWNGISRESQYHDEANSARNCRTPECS